MTSINAIAHILPVIDLSLLGVSLVCGGATVRARLHLSDATGRGVPGRFRVASAPRPEVRDTARPNGLPDSLSRPRLRDALHPAEARVHPGLFGDF